METTKRIPFMKNSSVCFLDSWKNLKKKKKRKNKFLTWFWATVYDARWVQCTWPNWKVDTLEFSGRKRPATPFFPSRSSSFASVSSRRSLCCRRTRSGYDESQPDQDPISHLRCVHCIFACSSEERREKKILRPADENFTSSVLLRRLLEN